MNININFVKFILIIIYCKFCITLHIFSHMFHFLYISFLCSQVIHFQEIFDSEQVDNIVKFSMVKNKFMLASYLTIFAY